MSISKPVFNYETLVHAMAGAMGSVFAMSTLYPLDIVKFRVQLEDENLRGKSTLNAILYILKNEGLQNLYQGISPCLLSLGVSNFVYFYSFHGLKALNLFNAKNSAHTDLVLSILAGVANVVVTLPLWVVNNRLKAKEPLPYSGLVDGVYHIATTEGLPALWASLYPSLILVSNPAIHFTVYEALKRRFPAKTAFAFFLMGAVAKTVSTVCTYPLQLVQTRQRKKDLANVNTAALLLSILKKNGPAALYQGLEAKLLQTIFTAALMFMTYEKIMRFVFKILMKSNRRKMS